MTGAGKWKANARNLGSMDAKNITGRMNLWIHWRKQWQNAPPSKTQHAPIICRHRNNQEASGTQKDVKIKRALYAESGGRKRNRREEPQISLQSAVVKVEGSPKKIATWQSIARLNYLRYSVSDPSTYQKAIAAATYCLEPRGVKRLEEMRQESMLT
ncbi:hypothetical protein FISHEDRAFT_60253 [Fistulina hepatica ATCC 64428]|uniref:Uncharacterized protein n=1 Tax=Fistulina hepatica ATCC 64428 TaxID=1128425 RepID=A0A0D7A759_9AGAR|nr:hypothetical protein FISHEDRAFT_60253 [Fistulina hepatica ATCC 64428]